MNVESRMDEFEKVSHKATNQDVEGRMDEFKTADKTQKHLIKEKSSSTLNATKHVLIVVSLWK